MAPMLVPDAGDGEAEVLVVLGEPGQAGRCVMGWLVPFRMVWLPGMEPQTPSFPGCRTSVARFGKLHHRRRGEKSLVA